MEVGDVGVACGLWHAATVDSVAIPDPSQSAIRKPIALARCAQSVCYIKADDPDLPAPGQWLGFWRCVVLVAVGENSKYCKHMNQELRFLLRYSLFLVCFLILRMLLSRNSELITQSVLFPSVHGFVGEHRGLPCGLTPVLSLFGRRGLLFKRQPTDARLPARTGIWARLASAFGGKLGAPRIPLEGDTR